MKIEKKLNFGMEITFLGVGCAFCLNLYQTNLLLRFNKTNLLVDCGGTAYHSLYDLGINGSDIQNIFITHLHGDHIGGLEQFALMAKYFWKTKPTLWIYDQLADILWDHSLRGALEFTEEGRVDLDYYFEVKRVKDTFVLDGERFELVPAEHVSGMYNFGLFFDGIYFSGDAKFEQERIKRMSARATTIIHDCDYIDNPVHTYIKDMLTLDEETRNKTILIHYSDDYDYLRRQAEPHGFRLARQHYTYHFENGIIQKIEKPE